MYTVVRQSSIEKALTSATRLSYKHGKGLFAVVEDRAVGGDEFPFAVVTFGPSYYDRKKS